MTVDKMPLVNVSPPLSADVCKGDGSDADGEGELVLFADILYGRTCKPQFKPGFKPQKR